MKQQRSHYRAEEKAKIPLETISRKLRSSEKRNTPNERQKRDAVGRPDWRSSFLRDPGAKFLGGKLNKKTSLNFASTCLKVVDTRKENC